MVERAGGWLDLYSVVGAALHMRADCGRYGLAGALGIATGGLRYRGGALLCHGCGVGKLCGFGIRSVPGIVGSLPFSTVIASGDRGHSDRCVFAALPCHSARTGAKRGQQFAVDFDHSTFLTVPVAAGWQSASATAQLLSGTGILRRVRVCWISAQACAA